MKKILLFIILISSSYAESEACMSALLSAQEFQNKIDGKSISKKLKYQKEAVEWLMVAKQNCSKEVSLRLEKSIKLGVDNIIMYQKMLP